MLGSHAECGSKIWITTITDTHRCAERGHSFPLTCTVCVSSRNGPVLATGGLGHYRKIPALSFSSHMGRELSASSSLRAAYRSLSENTTRARARGARQLPLIAKRTPHSHHPAAVCFPTTLILDPVNTLFLSLFARLTYPDFLLGRWPDSHWQSRVEFVDSGP